MSDGLPLRTLGATGLRVSPLGLAAMAVRFGGSAAPGLSAEEVERAFHEHGINTFLVHHRMRAQCEGVKRLIAAGHRDRLVLASEVSLPFAGSVRRGLEKNLRALGTDHLDVWLVGWVRARWYLRHAVWSELCRLREQGKVRAVGFSAHDRKLATALARELPADVLMIRYNAAHRGAEREVFEPLRDLGARRPGIVAYTATRWGMLLSPQPQRGFPRAMTGPECYRFALGHDMVDAVWCAARSPEELRDDVEGVREGPLSPERYEEVRRFGDAVHAAARGGRRWMFGKTSG
ncbi:MAG: aldo/keto reductase [Deltaproteobacteria bacterium]|nr:aldo/keto reductase [Deltaproteobacteria bacterium]